MKIRATFPQVYLLEHPVTGKYWMVSARATKWGLKERKSFTNEKDALDYARQIEAEIKKNGAQQNLPKEKIRYVTSYEKLIERLTPFSKTPEDAVEHYVKFLGDEILRKTIPTVRQLLEQWEAHKLLDRTLNDAYRNEIKLHCRFMRQTWGELKPDAIRKNEIESVLLKRTGTNNTRKKYLTFIRMFFNWVLAEDKKYIVTNPALGIRFKSEKFEKEFYSPETLKKFLKNVAESYKELVGYYALLTFAGLRPSEGARVEWKHINFSTKELHVVKGKTDARHIQIEPVAMEWLKWHQKSFPKGTPFVPRKNLFNLERKARGLMEKWIADGLRHGFATYYTSLKRDYPAVAWYMGNSVAMIKKHYARTIPSEQLNQFWELTPKNVFDA